MTDSSKDSGGSDSPTPPPIPPKTNGPPSPGAPGELVPEPDPSTVETGPFGLVESLLKRPFDLAARLRGDASRPTLVLLGIMVVNLVLFGLVVGSFAGGEQLWAAPVKIAGGLAVAGLICFPSLYILSCIGGADIDVGHLARGLVAALALIGILLVGFAPIVWIFSQSTEAIGFIGSIVLITWLISLWFGLGFLKRLFLAERTTSLTHYRVWAFMFALVTLQMSTAIRPLIGEGETFLPTEKKFFLQHWSDTLMSDADHRLDASERSARAEGEGDDGIQNPHVR